MKNKCIIVGSILEEDEEAVVMAAEVAVLVVAMEDHLTSTTTAVVSGDISNISVGHPEEEHMMNLKRTNQVVTKIFLAFTTDL